MIACETTHDHGDLAGQCGVLGGQKKQVACSGWWWCHGGFRNQSAKVMVEGGADVGPSPRSQHSSLSLLAPYAACPTRGSSDDKSLSVPFFWGHSSNRPLNLGNRAQSTTATQSYPGLSREVGPRESERDYSR
eukprot:1425896-Rhodomonas_salina.2